MSPSQFNMLRDISPPQMNNEIKVRVCRMWNRALSLKNAFIKAIEMVVIDEENTRIQVSLRPRTTNISLYAPMLKEGSVYVMKTLAVAENNQYPVTDHKYRLSFTQMTSLQKISDDDFHHNIFNFKSFADFDKSDETTHPFDVIAQISQRGQLRKINVQRNNEDRETEVLEIMIRNEYGASRRVTLWGKYAKQMDQHFNKDLAEPVVIILMFVRLTRVRDELLLTSCTYCSKILVNPDISAAIEFRERINQLFNDLDHQVIPMEVPHFKTLEEEFLQILKKKSILELIYFQEDLNYCVTKAKILSICNPLEWKYQTCKDCKKKVIPMGSKYFCEEHGDFVEPVMRFRVEVNVIDDQSSAIFVLWDDVVNRLTGYTVQQVSDLNAMQCGVDQNSHSQSFPMSIIEPFIGKELLFKLALRDLKLSQSTVKVSVSKVCSKDSIIAQFNEDLDSFDGTPDATPHKPATKFKKMKIEK